MKFKIDPKFLEDLLFMRKADIYKGDPISELKYMRLNLRQKALRHYLEDLENKRILNFLVNPFSKEMRTYRKAYKNYMKQIDDLNNYYPVRKRKDYYRKIQMTRFGLGGAGLLYAHHLLKNRGNNY